MLLLWLVVHVVVAGKLTKADDAKTFKALRLSVPQKETFLTGQGFGKQSKKRYLHLF